MGGSGSLRAGQFAVVAGTAAAIAAVADLEGALRALLAGMAALTGAGCGGVRLLADPARPVGPCRLFFWRGQEDYTWLDLENLPDSNTLQALTTGRGVCTRDLVTLAAAGDSSAQQANERDGLCSSLIVPLRGRGRAIGTLHADARTARAFRAAQLVPLQVLADHAGAAVEQARLVEALRAAQGNLDAALHIAGAVLYAYDAGGRITAVRGDTAALLGWPVESLLGRPLLDLLRPADRAAAAAQVAARLGGDTATHQDEATLTHRDGREVPVLIRRGPRQAGGRVIGGAGIVLDRTALRWAEAERDAAQAARARAEGAVRTGRAVAHTLASPVNVALGLAQLWREAPGLPAGLGEDLGMLEAEMTRAGELLKQFARIARYAEMPTPAGPQLDVERASRREPPG